MRKAISGLESLDFIDDWDDDWSVAGSIIENASDVFLDFVFQYF